MQTFTVQMSLVRQNAMCVAIKNKLKATDGINLLYDQDVWKRKEIEMKYYIEMDNAVFNVEEFAGCVRPAQVVNPLIDIIKAELQSVGVNTIESQWGPHVPSLGMLPIAYFFWLDAGVTIYVKK